MRVRLADRAEEAGKADALAGVRSALSAFSALSALLVACAKFAAPPGGPPDIKAPVLVGTVPDSMAVIPDFTGDVDFEFDQVVSEGNSPDFGLGTGDLEKLILLSPVSKQPVVRWHRDRISVHPKEGWQPNRVYRAELLPGLANLRRGVMKHGAVITFTTGAPLPTVTFTGTTIDWAGGRAAPLAVIEATLAPDSLVYRSTSDSSGRFSFGPLPRGSYLISGYVDQNHDLKRQYREAWDTIRVHADHDSVALTPFWMVQRDTTPPRMAPAQVQDSQSVVLSFTEPLDPYQRFDSLRVRLVTLPDSTPVPVVSLLTKAKDDSVRARAKALADSLRADSIAKAHPDTGAKARPDTSKARRAAPPPPPAASIFGDDRRPRVDSAMIKLIATRPQPTDKLVLRTGEPLKVEGKYFVEITGLRNVNHVGGVVSGGIQVPKPPPPPKLPAVDSTKKTRADSTKKAGTDSTTGAPADSVASIKKRLLKPRPVPADTTKP